MFQDKLIIVIAIIAISILLAKMVNPFISKRIAHCLKEDFLFKTKIVFLVEKGIRYIVFSIGLYVIVNLFVKYSFQVNLFRTAIILITSKTVHNILTCLEEFPQELEEEINNNFKVKIDRILVPFILKMAKFLNIVLVFGVVLSEWGIDVNGIITGLGIGGLALALGAQDIFSNIFGGIAIVVDKPFSIGDWISTSSGIEGIVEDISFRTTRLRTFEEGILVVPNAKLSNENTYNWTRRKRRRVSFNIKISQNNKISNIQAFISSLKKYLIENDMIGKDTLFVHLDSCNEYCYEVFVYYFIETTHWGDYLKQKENVNFKMLELMEENHLKVFVPTNIIEVEGKEGFLL